jgi:hypothetical protein
MAELWTVILCFFVRQSAIRITGPSHSLSLLFGSVRCGARKCRIAGIRTYKPQLVGELNSGSLSTLEKISSRNSVGTFVGRPGKYSG